jgi:outer membrane protein
MYQAVVELAKEQQFDLILSQGVVYTSDRVDITESVLKKLSKGN